MEYKLEYEVVEDHPHFLEVRPVDDYLSGQKL